MSDAASSVRWAWVDVDLDAIRHNVEHLRAVVAPSALWAVVKADGYGHGAVEVARAAIDGGAQGLCVALVHEGVELRQAGIDVPILVLSEQPADAADDIVRFRLMATVYSAGFIDALASAALERGVDGVPVHLKIDTGMQRVGVAVDDLATVFAALDAHTPTLRLVGVFTHLAMADLPDDEFTRLQLGRFDDALEFVVAAAAACSCTPRTRQARWRVRQHGARSCVPDRDLRDLAWPRRRRIVWRAATGPGVEGTGVLREAGVGGQSDLVRTAAHLRARHDSGDRADRIRRRSASSVVRSGR